MPRGTSRIVAAKQAGKVHSAPDLVHTSWSEKQKIAGQVRNPRIIFKSVRSIRAVFLATTRQRSIPEVWLEPTCGPFRRSIPGGADHAWQWVRARCSHLEV